MWGMLAEGGIATSPFKGQLLSADRIIHPWVIERVLGAIRTIALEFALELRSVSPEIGSTNGSTVERQVAQIVNNFFQSHVSGDGNQVAQGENIRQRSKVTKGDLFSLLRAAGEAGVTTDGKEQLARVVLAGEVERPGKIATFLARVREGTFLIGTGIAADVAATELSELIATYLG
jgi:hypothetical protein